MKGHTRRLNRRWVLKQGSRRSKQGTATSRRATKTNLGPDPTTSAPPPKRPQTHYFPFKAGHIYLEKANRLCRRTIRYVSFRVSTRRIRRSWTDENREEKRTTISLSLQVKYSKYATSYVRKTTAQKFYTSRAARSAAPETEPGPSTSRC